MLHPIQIADIKLIQFWVDTPEVLFSCCSYRCQVAMRKQVSSTYGEMSDALADAISALLIETAPKILTANARLHHAGIRQK